MPGQSPRPVSVFPPPLHWIWLAALLVGATWAAYFPVLHAGFIFDDNVFLTDNPLIRASDGLRRFWFTTEPADYWPVTSTTLWLEWRLWGANASGYHLTNLILHLTDSLLLWSTLDRLRIPGAFLGALIFAVHPLNAESVVWITERKNLLALLFYLLCIRCFFNRGRTAYGLAIVAFVLGMLSKGSVVILPFVLFGLVAWRRRPTALDAWRLAPFAVIAAGLAAWEGRFSTVLPVAAMQPLGMIPRLLRAAGIVWFYAGKTVWPFSLAFDYGQWGVRAEDWRWWLPLAAGCVLAVLLWKRRDGALRPLLFAAGYFCVALLPALGFVEVGFMAYSPVSNHYTQLALVGATALAGAAGTALYSRLGPVAGRAGRPILLGAATVMIALLGVATCRQTLIYRDAGALYRDTVARNPQSWMGHTNLGAWLIRQHETAPALQELAAAVALKPDFPDARNDLGVALYQSERRAEAIAEYREALRLRPAFYQARNNLGVALARSGRIAEAVEQFRAALEVAPDYGEAQANLSRAEKIERGERP